MSSNKNVILKNNRNSNKPFKDDKNKDFSFS